MVASSAKSSDATNAATALRRVRERTKSENDDVDRDRLHWCGAAARDVVLALVISVTAVAVGFVALTAVLVHLCCNKTKVNATSHWKAAALMAPSLITRHYEVAAGKGGSPVRGCTALHRFRGV
jgi:hypothetical protein